MTPAEPHGTVQRNQGIEILGPVDGAYAEILTRQALQFVATLERRYRTRRLELMVLRAERQTALDRGERPHFLPQSDAVREGTWRVAPPPPEILDRRVEITGPVDRKMIINALNSGANVFMADFEDSSSPTWSNMIEGQINLRDAVRRTIEYRDPESGKEYRLGEDSAVLFVRPRGWHLLEKHVLVDKEPVSASIFDFALFMYHNAKEQLARGNAPYFYLPKLENHLEARLWNDIIVDAQERLGIAVGTVKATVLIETILAAFEMEEILYELREHSAGLNCGRWDYIFSFIKKLRRDPSCVLPDRALVGMDQHFLRSYSHMLIQVCHRRGAHAMGGMAAQIPIKNDPEANRKALDKVRADKRREAEDGHDGTWVAHPGLVEIAREEFDRAMPAPNQIHKLREEVHVSADDLLRVPSGPITEAGLRQNLSVGILYLESWLRGRGCVPINDLMEDAATAEISRTQVWQWLHHGAELEDGRTVDESLFRQILDQEVAAIRETVGEERFEGGRFQRARMLFDELIVAPELADFLTLAAYDHL